MTKARRRDRWTALSSVLLAACMSLSCPSFSAFAQEDAPPSTPPVVQQPAQPGELDALEKRRDQNRQDLQELVDSIGLSEDKSRQMQESIAALNLDTTRIKDELIASAQRRKDLEAKINDGEDRLAKLGIRDDEVKASLRERRGVLAEVLAALQRMGRNPPPALLVSPEDALASVRSAILLGAVVPGIRGETDKLVSALKELTDVRQAIAGEKEQLTTAMTSSLEEEKRLDLLRIENEKRNRQTASDLEAERKRSEELASKATSLEGLVASLENEISSVRDAKEQERLEEERMAALSQSERDKVQAQTEAGMPDKNRIAPAYPFSSLKGKLVLPVSGDVLRRFGDADGTGHFSKGMVVATGPEALVTAPADGFVVFAGEFRSYGRMIILNAGDGYHLVLTGMDNVRTRQGMFVFSGEPIASMGAKRVASAAALALETDRPTLYIEFRKDGVPVDSQPWWTAKNTGRARNDS
ncbi:murein hydrolase activator EnvC family protein [Agrobacterium sp. rho-13.3]|uniref:murein hydrolase activator EnvC family protein n=1 Tax=Agrobacterium sp. rho-13.3 TaxID=3072980 RepID=UPI002A128E29|nr:murein hydrolase activator EnvC [Agrobacterium sp. rho-13.3]MDX8310659.1 murein hydrolase activator EnvC [Agrobacterium sp. rho-13.3]